MNLTEIARSAAATVFDMAGSGSDPLAETVTLRSRGAPAAVAVTAEALVSQVSAFDQLALQGVTERLIFQVSELGSFTINSATTIQRSGGVQRPIADSDIQTVADAVVIVNWRGSG